jgi:drug/metabolite transporter (DMT)-like permease
VSSAAFGIPLALVTTSAFNTGLILEKRALTNMSALNVRKVGRTLVSLLSNPAWLAGFALMLGGLACQVVVLTFEPISLVQPILASGVALTLVLSRLFLRERLGGAESWCVAALAASLILLALSQEATGSGSTRQPSVIPMVATIAPSVAAGLLITLWPQRVRRRLARGAGGGGSGRQLTAATGIYAGIGTGLLYGVGALMSKGLSGILSREHTALGIGLGIASSPYLYLLAGCSATAMLLYQGALQASRASILIPVSSVVSSVYFVIVGTVLFHEHLPANPVRLGLRLAGIAAAGLVIVAMSRQAASGQAVPGQVAQTHAMPRHAVPRPGGHKHRVPPQAGHRPAAPRHAVPKNPVHKNPEPRHAVLRDPPQRNPVQRDPMPWNPPQGNPVPWDAVPWEPVPRPATEPPASSDER